MRPLRKSGRRAGVLRLASAVAFAIVFSTAAQPSAPAWAAVAQNPLAEEDPVAEWVVEEGPVETLTLEQARLEGVATQILLTSLEESLAEQMIVATTCKSRTGSVVARSVSGRVNARYKQRVSWCYRPGVTITGVNRRAWGETYSPLVDFVRTVDSWKRGGAGFHSFTGYAKGDFCVMGRIGGACLFHVYPWVQVFVTDTGFVKITAGR